jgi:TolB protein
MRSAERVRVVTGSRPAKGKRRGVVIAASAAALLAVLDGAAQAAPDTTILVSRASGASGPAADDNSFSPSVSSTGRFVAFQSNANNLSADDNDLVDENIFVRDLTNRTTTLVSRANGASGDGGDDSSSVPSISGDGRFVAFQSRANNLSTTDNNAFENIFIRDLRDRTTRLVSQIRGVAADGDSFLPSISADGRFVAFQSDADNLSRFDNNAVSNVFRRDLRTGEIRLVSRTGGATGPGGDDASGFPAISGDGRFVVFESRADNLSPTDNNAVSNIFVRDLQT